ncbi:hypothetical protein IPG41_02445 [Candidatus Peregrinibacteria bacterium]|nr:MAG: hypothetical protein IPG41_02445 [Candidatus Peregrinibacteria bacterium]
MNKSLFKKILLSIMASALFWSLTQGAWAVIQIPDITRPDNLPGFEPIDTENSEHPELNATQNIILFVGSMVSQVLLFMATIAIIFVILAGANYIFAFGKDERIERGKRGVFWSLAGLIIILLSYSVVQGVISLILQVDFSTR